MKLHNPCIVFVKYWAVKFDVLSKLKTYLDSPIMKSSRLLKGAISSSFRGMLRPFSFLANTPFSGLCKYWFFHGRAHGRNSQLPSAWACIFNFWKNSYFYLPLPACLQLCGAEAVTPPCSGCQCSVIVRILSIKRSWLCRNSRPKMSSLCPDCWGEMCWLRDCLVTGESWTDRSYNK